MATALQICNSALIKLGAKTISAMTGGTTKEAELVYARYPRLRNALLRSHRWAFAKVVVENLTTVPADALTDQYAYKHTLPTDIGRIWHITDVVDCDVDYELIGSYIYSNTDPLRLRYVRSYADVDDGATFPDDFGEALSCLLAADICVSLTQNQSLRDTYLQAYLQAIADARFNGAIERPSVPSVSEDWLEAHQGLSYPADPPSRPTNAEESLLLE